MDAFEQVLQIDPNSLGRRDVLGEKGFDAQIPQLKWIHSTISEAINIGRKTDNLPPGFWMQIQNHAQRFIRIAEQINRYRIDSDAQSQYSLRNGIVRQIDDFYNSFFSGDKIDTTQNNSERNNFLTLLNTLQNLGVESLRSRVSSAVEKSEGELNVVKNIREKAEAAAGELSSRAFQPGTLALYAGHFSNEAKLHSRLGQSKIDNPKKEGKKIRPPMAGAEKWLVAGILQLVATSLLLIGDLAFLIYCFLKKIEGYPAIAITIGAVAAIIFYGSRFSLKQYSIHKHLFTLDRHRANSLSSFFSMSESGGLDESSRSEISKIVARAIYESSHTGYMAGDSTEINLPVTIDAIRGLISPK